MHYIKCLTEVQGDEIYFNSFVWESSYLLKESYRANLPQYAFGKSMWHLIPFSIYSMFLITASFKIYFKAPSNALVSSQVVFFFQITFFFFLLSQLFSLGKDPEGVSVDAV